MRTIRYKLASAYIRNELPGWGKIYPSAENLLKEIIGFKDEVEIIGKLHGLRLFCDLNNWSERQTYLLGRFYDLPLQKLLVHYLRPGTTFVDIGANIGMISLLASHLVGSDGNVIAFEPNPKPRAKFQKHLDVNDIGNVKIFNCGLGDVKATLELKIVTDHSGMGTLGEVSASESALITDRFLVDVQVGDDILLNAVTGKSIIKIDVEGFEVQVLKGLEKTLSQAGCMVVTETVENHLKRANESVQSLLAYMSSLGYLAHTFKVVRHGLRSKLEIAPFNPIRLTPTDLLWSKTLLSVR